MSDSDNVDYLHNGFDPWSLTVPRLRSILVTYDVGYPSTAKKPQLIDLFNEHILPRAPAILETRRRAKRTSMGIVDMPSQESTDRSTNHDDEPARPPQLGHRTRSRSPRKASGRTTRASTVESEDHGPAPVLAAPSLSTVRESPRKRSTRSVSVADTTDTDTTDYAEGMSATGRRRRQRRTATPAAATVERPFDDEATPTPVVRRTDEATPVARRTISIQEAEDSPFSNDNPFQSGGSSPPAAPKTPMGGRRKSASLEPAKTKAAASASRRRTDGPAFEPHELSTAARIPSMALERQERHVNKVPEPELKHMVPQIASPEPGEEFTPDEQLALEREEHAHPDLQIARRKPQTSRRTNWSTPIWVLAATLLSAYAAWYRQEKIAVGYCGLGRDPKQLIPSHIPVPEWADEFTSKIGFTSTDFSVPALPDWARPFIEPDCEPCPAHAYCYEDYSVRCQSDFVLKPHPLSFGGLLPLSPTCEPDGQKVRRVQAVADRAIEELRERRARFECGELAEDESQPASDAGIDEQELKAAVKQKRNKRMGDDEFDDLWAAAIGEAKARDEVEVEEPGPASDVTDEASPALFPQARLSSTSLARLSYTCAARRSVKLGLARHRLTLAGALLALWSAWYGRRALRTHRALAAQVPALVDEVLERLASQKELAFDSDGSDDAFLFLPNLRDDVLRSMHRLADRDRLWQRVRAVVEQNSNVRTGQREGHNGEVGRAWEWIGPSRLGPPPPASGAHVEGVSRRRSGRVSWGGGAGAGAGSGAEDTIEERRRKQQQRPAAPPEVSETRMQSRRWEESRPIY